MLKRFFTLSLIAFIIAPAPSTQAAAASLPITAPTALLLDHSSNRIVYAKTPHLRRAPASTTKLLTSIVALELLSADAVVTVPRYATKMPPSKIYLRSGERYRLRDLIHALLMNSANDVAATIAIASAGSVSSFAKHMNKKARQLGCLDSNFVNPSGLPDKRQYSTVYDMALIMREAQRNPLIVNALKTRTSVIRSSQGRKINLRNHNKMLWRDPREVLGKTGWTRAARHCFVGQISFSGKKVFVALLGSHRLWQDLKKLVDYEFGYAWVRHVRAQKQAARVNNQKIQTALKKAGYYKGAIDGKIGPKTKRAIKSFQKHHKLKPDGVVGSKTWTILKPYL